MNYGINVAKVREVINQVPVTQMPKSHPYVDGIFTLRGRVIPLVNLLRCLGSEDQESTGKNIIISELNTYFVGYLVNEVSRIHRVSWSAMEPPPNVADSEMAIGIIKMEEKLEEIRKTKQIIVVEDSKMLRDLLIVTLHKAGYINITAYHNGKDAWDALAALADTGVSIEENVHMLITDIEMPQMDGHHLLKRIGATGQVSKPEFAQLINLIDTKSL